MSFCTMGIEFCLQLWEAVAGSPQCFALGHLPHVYRQKKGLCAFLELRLLKY